MGTDRRFFLSCVFGALILGILPFALGQVLTPPGAVFYGNKVIAPADYSIYYSYIIQGSQGHIFMYDAFTSELHASTLFQPVWYIVGLGAKLFNLSAPAAFAMARYMMIPVFIFVLWWVAGWLWPDNKRQRRLGFLASILVSGLGGILTIVGISPDAFPWTYPDLWVSEMYSVLTLWSSAHFLLVTSGIPFVLVAVERSWLEKKWSWTVWAGLIAIMTLAIHPFHIVTWIILWTGLTISRWIQNGKFPWSYLARWMSVIGISSPIILLYLLQLRYDPATIQRAIQNINITPPLLLFVSGLGVPLVFALFGTWWWKIKNERWLWLVWLGLAYVTAVYLPVPFQRRLTQGMLLPFVWLSVPVFEKVLFYFTQKGKRSIAYIFITIALASSWLYVGVYIVQDYLDELQKPARMYYIDQEHQALAQYLATTNPHQPLLSSLIESNIIAGQTAHQVYVGYGVETWKFDEKILNMENFFQRMNMAEQRLFLQRADICYVLVSPRTQAKGLAFQPALWPDLKIVWSSASLTLYQTPNCR